MQGAEQRLKTQILYILLGLILSLAPLPALDWFRVGSDKFSVLGTSGNSREDLIAASGHCVTGSVGAWGFVCAGPRWECDVVGSMRTAGKRLVTMTVGAVPLYIWVCVNLGRKLRKLRTLLPLTPTLFDSDICMYLAPTHLALSYTIWLLSLPSDVSIGTAFQHAMLGAAVLAWGCFHYFAVTRGAFAEELRARSVFY